MNTKKPVELDSCNTVLIIVLNKSYWILQARSCLRLSLCGCMLVGGLKIFFSSKGGPGRKGLGNTNLNNGMSLVCNYSNESPGVMSVPQFLKIMSKSFPNTAIFQDKQIVLLQTHVIWLSRYCCVRLVVGMLELLC